MWPWEHLAVGYLIYSGYSRIRTRRSPANVPTLVLALCTQLPDIVDKPLAWTFGVVSDGTAIGHSIFVVAPLLVFGTYLERSRSAVTFAPAVGIGYLSHLVADAVYPLLAGKGPIAPSVMLWPLVRGSGSAGIGFIPQFRHFFVDFVHFLGTPLGSVYLLLEVLLVGGAVVVWIRDGVPGLRPLTRQFEKALAMD